MKNSKQLRKEYDQVKNDVTGVLYDLISKNLGKRVITEDEQDSGDFLTFTDSMSGANKDFHLVGIGEDGELLTIEEDGTEIEGMKVNQIEVWARIDIIEMLEEL